MDEGAFVYLKSCSVFCSARLNAINCVRAGVRRTIVHKMLCLCSCSPDGLLCSAAVFPERPSVFGERCSGAVLLF